MKNQYILSATMQIRLILTPYILSSYKKFTNKNNIQCWGQQHQ